jgi:hypothetical protein
MMTIADIYDALSALDRPYKKAVASELALDKTSRAQATASPAGNMHSLVTAIRKRKRNIPGPHQRTLAGCTNVGY